MSAFFQRALLIERDGPLLRYRYYPDFHIEPDLCGEFEFDVRDGSVRILVPTNWGPRTNNWDEISAVHLSRKISSHVRTTGLYPSAVHYIA